MSMVEVLADKKSEILRIAERYGARNVRIFGSVARGDDAEDSDVDFLVDFDPGRSLIDHAGLALELRELLGRRVDIASSKGLRPRVRDRVLSEAASL